MNSNFLSKSNSLRMQARTKRENMGLTQQQLAQLLNEKYGKEYDNTVIARFETQVREDEAENANKNINLELLYLIYLELRLKIDSILFQEGIQNLFSNDYFDNKESVKKYNNNLEKYKEIMSEIYSKSKVEELSKNSLYKNLRNSGLKSFLPAQISFISPYCGGTTTLISLLTGVELEIGMTSSEYNDVYYIHKDFKPFFYPEEQNNFTFNKEDFNLGSIFNNQNEQKQTEKEKVLVKFIDSPVLKFCTILDTKYQGRNLSFDLLKESQHNILVSNYESINHGIDEDTKIIIKLNKEFGDNSDSYVMTNDYLNNFTIIFSRRSNLMKKEIEEIKSAIISLIKPNDIIRIDIKESLKKTILRNIYSYDSVNPESYNNIRNEFEKIINKAKRINNFFELDAIPAVKELNYIKSCNYDSVINYYKLLPPYFEDLKQIINNNNEQGFSSKSKTMIDDFIENELNEEFFKKLDYINYKENTKCIIINKDFIEKLETDINKKIYTTILTIVWELSFFDYHCLQNKDIIEKYGNYTYQYRNRIFAIMASVLHNNLQNEKFIDEFISDVANSNRPTAKYFIKRFKEFKNKNGNTLNNKIYIHIKTLLDNVLKTFEDEGIMYFNILQGTTSDELETYISLYNTIYSYQAKCVDEDCNEMMDKIIKGEKVF